MSNAAIDMTSSAFATRLARLLRMSRRDRGRSLRTLARAGGGVFTARQLRSLEAGRMDLAEVDLTALAELYQVELAEILPQRLPIEVDGGAGRIATSGIERRFSVGDEDTMLVEYLRLVRDLRDVPRQPTFALRREDVEVLAEQLKLDGSVVVERLADLMSLTVAQRRSMTTAFAAGAALVLLTSTAIALEPAIPEDETPDDEALVVASAHEDGQVDAGRERSRSVRFEGSDADDRLLDRATPSSVPLGSTPSGSGDDTAGSSTPGAARDGQDLLRPGTPQVPVVSTDAPVEEAPEGSRDEDPGRDPRADDGDAAGSDGAEDGADTPRAPGQEPGEDGEVGDEPRPGDADEGRGGEDGLPSDETAGDDVDVPGGGEGTTPGTGEDAGGNGDDDADHPGAGSADVDDDDREDAQPGDGEDADDGESADGEPGDGDEGGADDGSDPGAGGGGDETGPVLDGDGEDSGSDGDGGNPNPGGGGNSGSGGGGGNANPGGGGNPGSGGGGGNPNPGGGQTGPGGDEGDSPGESQGSGGSSQIGTPGESGNPNAGGGNPNADPTADGASDGRATP